MVLQIFKLKRGSIKWKIVLMRLIKAMRTNPIVRLLIFPRKSIITGSKEEILRALTFLL